MIGKKQSSAKHCESPPGEACIGLLVDTMNDLAADFRENKAKIDKLRRQLDIVRRPVPR
jgi:hypothetical protein